jgi:starch phosphorylase
MQGRRVVRVFISSPTDVDRERRAAAAVVRRLDREFRRFFSVEPFLWEHERQLASGHFQDAVDPTEFDIAVLILWSRLGTHLPERTRKREYRGVDGRTPVTGTEWEYEHARAHAEATGAPALLVFRNHGPAPFSTTDPRLRAQQDAQLRALDRFWERHFHDRDVFLTAFTGYTRLGEFEEKLTEQLREVLQDFIQRGWSRAAAPAITWFESPFRGLEAYDFKHSPIFYGRDAATRQAVEQLAANAAAGAAFLLVLGASGSGKSSLVRAGVLPDLAVPNAIPGVRAWRRVLFRPSASPGDLFAGLARQIVQADPEDPGVGLAEVVSDYFPLKQLARYLRDNAAAPAAPIQLALGQVAANLQDRGEVHPGEQVRLVVVIDQLEELFAEPAIGGERFILMLAGLARSGAVWVIATMRSDFWHRIAELPLLAELASGASRLDLWSPSAIELADIIRQPAVAAGLRFEREHGIGLDEQIAVDAASAPGVLPLLSYTLEALYKRDVERTDSRLLLWESYGALGGLHGAIARRADDMVTDLHRDAVDDHVIARVMRRLVSLDESDGGRVIARTAPLTDFAPGSPERRLVDAFLRSDIRLIVAEGDMIEARVRVAHEALLTHWDRARRLLAEDTINLARRRRLEEAERRWREAEPEERAGLLLRPGWELNEAEALMAAWADEIPQALRDYIAKSHNDALYERRLRLDDVVDPLAAGAREHFEAVARSVRAVLAQRWITTERTYNRLNPKRIYYLSMEFLIGRSLTNNVINLLLERRVAQQRDLDWFGLLEEEPDAGLGNGGLGRLAACFLDSMATMELPGMGYGLRYEYGMFRQTIEDGWQREHPDNWLRRQDPWEVPRLREAVEIKLLASLNMHHGSLEIAPGRPSSLIGIPFDRPVVGYGGKTINTLRLWAAVSPDYFGFQEFSSGDFVGALAGTLAAESLTRVLYPDDRPQVGQELRFVQEYFLVACSLADLVRRFHRRNGDWRLFPDKVAIQLNDTRPTLAVPELMRILLDEAHLGWDEAWDITQKTLGYTNHTVLPEDLERWPLSYFEKLLPRQLEIIFQINERFLDAARTRWPGDDARVARMSLIEEGAERKVRMANLAIVGSHSTNGVAGMHSALLRKLTVKDFAEMFPERFNNKTNGVTPRRWLLLANPGLAHTITDAIGDQWVTDLDELQKLRPLADDAAYRESFLETKRAAKLRFVDWVKTSSGVTVDPETIFDCQIKRIHEYKRQLLNALRIIVLYNRLRTNPDLKIMPRTFFFAGKAAPAYHLAKLIIKFLNNLADTIDGDPATRDRLKVVFLPEYCVSLAERLIPAADVSNQISTAGYEASGTSNMKFMLNGALTLGTRDGATIEMAEEAGEDNFFLFGLTADQVEDSRSWYNPHWHYDNEPETRAALNLFFADHFSRYEPGVFAPLGDALMTNDDHYMHLADLKSYLEADHRLTELYADSHMWARKAILNVAGSGKFSSDRTIAQYAAEIWNAKPCPVP